MIYIFNYNFDIDEIKRRYDLEKFEVYSDPRKSYTWPTYKIARIKQWNYANKLITDLGLGKLDVRPRFYWLGPNTRLGGHTDNNTACSINFIINEDYAPIIVDGKEYVYKSALLNCQVVHGVPAFHKDRRLFKLSIFDKSYDEVLNIIKDKI